MNFLTDVDIIKWNDRISEYNIMPSYTTKYNKPVIIISNEYEPFSQSGKSRFDSPTMSVFNESDISICGNVYKEYETSFSIKMECKDIFNEIFNNLLKIEFETYIDINKNNSSDRLMSYNSDKIFEKISVDKDITINEETELHRVNNEIYIKYTYKYKGRLTSIMANISCLEDAIEYLQLIWGMNPLTQIEGNLMKYPKNTIVSKSENKSKDWLVNDYIFSKDENSNYNVKYKIIEILDLKSSIIRYGETLIVSESQLCHSRNDRINKILNK